MNELLYTKGMLVGMMTNAHVEFMTIKSPPEMKTLTKEQIEQKMADTMSGANENKKPELTWMTPEEIKYFRLSYPKLGELYQLEDDVINTLKCVVRGI